MFLVHVYVDNIIFGSTNDNLYKRFAKLLQSKFEMSLMGELKFFLGLQVDQRLDGRTPQEVQHGGFSISMDSIIYSCYAWGM